ncbi:MAG: zinc ribbon domain-containing protein [Desulfobulbaceae bacterium]|nr:MAG: zinc ribbon domain-containing protein [Desulfobulbaceae bacterium]
MPIYEYQCNECKTIFEALVTTASKMEPISCSTCKSNNVRKILSSSGFRQGLNSSAQSGVSGQKCNSRGGFS